MKYLYANCNLFFLFFCKIYLGQCFCHEMIYACMQTHNTVITVIFVNCNFNGSVITGSSTKRNSKKTTPLKAVIAKK